MVPSGTSNVEFSLAAFQICRLVSNLDLMLDLSRLNPLHTMVHFSMTPRIRTDTSGFLESLIKSHSGSNSPPSFYHRPDQERCRALDPCTNESAPTPVGTLVPRMQRAVVKVVVVVKESARRSLAILNSHRAAIVIVVVEGRTLYGQLLEQYRVPRNGCTPSGSGPLRRERSIHRADAFAGGILAMLTSNTLIGDLRLCSSPEK